MKIFYFISLCVILLSCKKWQASREEEPLAKVNGSYLYPSDISGNNYLVQDSSFWRNEQIDFWIKKQLWLAKADKNIATDEIEKKVQDYKESLLVDALKKAHIQKAKLVVTEEMIVDYYIENQASFSLADEMYRLQYFLLEDTADENDLVKLLNAEEIPEAIKIYCSNAPSRCMLNASWVGKTVLEDLGIPSYLWVSSTKFQKYFLDDNRVCIYRIDSKKKEGEVAPLEEVKGDIMQILIFQMEKDLIQKMEDELLINAQNNKSFEIY